MSYNRKSDIKNVFTDGKIPPHAKEIEAIILGTIMLNHKLVHKAREILIENDFYATANRLVYKIILELDSTTKPEADLVAQKAQDKGLIDEIGGVYYISTLLNKVCEDTNLEKYCLIVKQKAIQRRLIEFGAEILSSANDEMEDVFDVLMNAENKLKGINTELDNLSSVSNLEVSMNVIRDFDDKVYKAQNNIVDENATYTHIPEWDEINGALFPGLYVIAGRPGMGKGVHLTELICRMSKIYDIGVINGEMTDEQLLKRVGCNLMGIDNFLFKKNPASVTKKEQEQLHAAMNEAINLRFSIENSKNIHKIRDKIRNWVLNKGVKCILADFLTLFRVPPDMQKYYVNKTQEVDYVLNIFVDLCKELNVPIILYAQMNREILGRHGVKEPHMGDLKQSGSIEELAFQVMFLHRPEYYDETLTVDEFGENTKGLMYNIIAKHRDGRTNVKIKQRVDLAKSQMKSWNNNLYINLDGKLDEMPF
jgi:replicative DNA helicase